MLFGGWSRNMADFVTSYDLTSLRDRLVSWGFAESNIRTFFANGIKTAVDEGKRKIKTRRVKKLIIQRFARFFAYF